MQDTTSSAMTEVALGLSMAFFTLLIVALLSMSIPKESVIEVTSTIPKDIKENDAIDIKTNNKHSIKPSNNDAKQFAFYFNNKFYDKTLAVRTVENFAKDKALVIAVEPTLAFSEVFALKQKIQHPKLSITTSNKAWNTRLKQIAALD